MSSARFHYRYIGNARIAIRWAGTTQDGRERYGGNVQVGAGDPSKLWSFDDVSSGVGGVSALRLGDGRRGCGGERGRSGTLAVDSPEAFDIMGEPAYRREWNGETYENVPFTMPEAGT